MSGYLNPELERQVRDQMFYYPLDKKYALISSKRIREQPGLFCVYVTKVLEYQTTHSNFVTISCSFCSRENSRPTHFSHTLVGTSGSRTVEELRSCVLVDRTSQWKLCHLVKEIAEECLQQTDL